MGRPPVPKKLNLRGAPRYREGVRVDEVAANPPFTV